jgi:hypothetical protein
MTAGSRIDTLDGGRLVRPTASSRTRTHRQAPLEAKGTKVVLRLLQALQQFSHRELSGCARGNGLMDSARQLQGE